MVGGHDVQKLWPILDRLRRTGSQLSLAQVVHLCAREGVIFAPGDLGFLVGSLGAARVSPDSLCPPGVASFIADLAWPHTNGTVLDPFAGFGTLLDLVVAVTKPPRVIAAHPNAEALAAAKLLRLPDAVQYEWEHGWAFETERPERDVDVAVSMLPLGGATREVSVRGVQLRDDVGHALLVHSAARLRPGGIGVFVVAPRFLAPECGARQALTELGLHVDGWFHLPSGTLAPLTHVETGIVVIRPGPPPPSIFVAAFSADMGARGAIFERYRKRAAHEDPALGALVPLEGFDGLPKLLARRRIEALDPKHRARVRLSDVALDIRRCPTDRSALAAAENSVFLPLVVSGRAVVELDALPKDARGFAQIVLDPSRALAPVVAELLNSPDGRDARFASAAGTTVPRLGMSSVGSLPVYLPPLAVQRAIVELDQRMTAISGQLHELRTELWSGFAPSEVAPQLERLHRDDSFTDWLESLPFPLASVLWSYHAASSDPRKQYERLDYFFEALTAFLATLVLSAARRDPAFFGERWQATRAALENAHHSLDRPSVGTWRVILESLAKPIRSALAQPDTREHWCNLFAIDDEELLGALLSKEMTQLLLEANQRRNAWRGHGGPIGDDIARVRRSELLDLLSRFRALVGRRWAGYPLVMPSSMRLSGGVYHTQVALVMGSRYPFAREELPLHAACEADHLHAVSRRRGVTMPLLPFVRLGSSPTTEQNACYFFNRVEGEDGLRFVSYHFEAKPDVDLSDPAVRQVLTELGGP